MFQFLNKKISTLLAIIIIILCAVLAGGITVYQYYGIPKEEGETPEEKVSKDETADWKTYRNGEYGYEIKYPEDWTFKEAKSIKTVTFGEEREVKPSESIFKPAVRVTFYQDACELWENEEQCLPLEDWLEWFSKIFPPLGKEGETIESTTFGVDNYKGILVKEYRPIDIPEYMKLITVVYCQKNGMIYEIGHVIVSSVRLDFPTKYNYDEVLNQMLSTFRFIE